MGTRAAVVSDGSTVLRFAREGLAEVLSEVFGGPVGLTPDALDLGERDASRPRSRVLQALMRERQSGRIGHVAAFVHGEGQLWVPVRYRDDEAGMASALRDKQMNKLPLEGQGAFPERRAQWLGAGCAEALAVAHFQALALMTCCALTRRVSRHVAPQVELYDGISVLESARDVIRLRAS